MNIVFLDAFTSNHGDLDWSLIEEHGNLTIYDRTDPGQIIERAAGADVLITNKVVFTRELFKSLSALKYLCVAATGYNNIDVAAAKDFDVPVSNVVGYSTQSVAQNVFALLLALFNQTEKYSKEVKSGSWSSCQDFSYWHEPIPELNGLTMGIYGFGKIGQSTAKIALAFGMNVIAVHKHPKRDQMNGVQFVDWDTMIKDSDVISLHAPLTDQNKGVFNKQVFTEMKSSSILINTSRGPVIHENDLAEALNTGQIAGAGMDVLSQEPPSPDNPLLKARNCLITPHHAWASQPSRKRLLEGIAKNIKSYKNGTIINRVS